MTTPRDDLMALAPCPFCGGEAKLVSSTSSTVQCQNDQCIIGSPAPFNDFTHRHDAIAAWNTRLAASRPAPVDREAVARLIVGPRLPVPSWSQFTLEQLQKVRWDSTPTAEQKDALNAADAILSLFRPAEPVEAKWRPIETAPKEDPERPGRDFEIIVGGGEIKDESADLLPWRPFDSWSLACYDSMRGCWRGEQTEQYDCFYLHKPTHWMPKFAGPGQCGSTTPDAVSEPAEAALGGWTYEIQHGPDGEAAYAWVYDEEHFLVCTAKIHHAKMIVARMNDAPPKSPDTSAAVLAERERCAAIADEWANKMARNHGRETANTIAAAIRQLPTTERGE